MGGGELASSTGAPRHLDVGINRERLCRRLDELALLGAIAGTQRCSRLALTDDDRAGRDLVVTWMRELNLDVVIDGVGNVVGTMPGFEDHPAVMTPMTMRRDPMVAVARLAEFVHELATEFGHPQVATVGKVDLHPNLVNVIPASAEMTVDLRNTDELVLQRAEQRLAEFVTETATALGLEISSTTLARFEPVEFDRRIVNLIERVAEDRGEMPFRLPSGSVDDGEMMARLGPTGMIFVPSRDGVSHNPAEHTDDDDLARSADVLLHTMVHLAEEPS